MLLICFIINITLLSVRYKTLLQIETILWTIKEIKLVKLFEFKCTLFALAEVKLLNYCPVKSGNIRWVRLQWPSLHSKCQTALCKYLKRPFSLIKLSPSGLQTHRAGHQSPFKFLYTSNAAWHLSFLVSSKASIAVVPFFLWWKTSTADVLQKESLLAQPACQLLDLFQQEDFTRNGLTSVAVAESETHVLNGKSTTLPGTPNTLQLFQECPVLLIITFKLLFHMEIKQPWRPDGRLQRTKTHLD